MKKLFFVLILMGRGIANSIKGKSFDFEKEIFYDISTPLTLRRYSNSDLPMSKVQNSSNY